MTSVLLSLLLTVRGMARSHSTAAWTYQQLREAFPWEQAPRYLVRDRDHAFEGWTGTAKATGIEEVRTTRAPRGRTRPRPVHRLRAT